MRQLRVALFGSTGSIGRSTVDVIRHLGKGYKLVLIAANRSVREICVQAREFQPKMVLLTEPMAANRARRILGRRFKVLSDLSAVDQLLSEEIDIVIMAMSGTVGLTVVLKALRSGKRVALATKELMVAYGEIIMQVSRRYGGVILPVDSELAAIHQCLDGRPPDALRRVILTASGGPFWRRGLPDDVRISEVLKHPTWRMGKKITVDSATLMNKGLEVIETVRFFGIQPEQVEVVIHPESVVHSMVEFNDGSVLAQLSNPDMRLPIQYCITYPRRLPGLVLPFDFKKEHLRLDFYPVSQTEFPCLQLAFRALKGGAGATCVLNAANERAVAAFLENKIAFGSIPVIVEKTLGQYLKQDGGRGRFTVARLMKTERWAREYSEKIIMKTERK